MSAKFPERKIEYAHTIYHSDIENFFIASDLKSEWNLRGLDCEIKQSSAIKKLNLSNNAVFISKTKSGDLYGLSAYFINSRFLITEKDLSKGITDFKTKDGTLLPLKFHHENPTEQYKKITYLIIKKVKINQNKHLLFVLGVNDRDRNYIKTKLFNNEFKLDLLNSFKGEIPEEFEILLKIKGSKPLASSHEVIYNSTNR